jgi:hypothetical protein
MIMSYQGHVQKATSYMVFISVLFSINSARVD